MGMKLNAGGFFGTHLERDYKGDAFAFVGDNMSMMFDDVEDDRLRTEIERCIDSVLQRHNLNNDVEVEKYMNVYSTRDGAIAEIHLWVQDEAFDIDDFDACIIEWKLDRNELDELANCYLAMYAAELRKCFQI